MATAELYIYTMEYYSAITENEIMPSAATWMDLEIVILSEIRDKEKYHMIWLIYLKSRDITLLTKVHLVKAMVFPEVMYRCESWTIKKAEYQRIDAFELWCCGAGEDS